MIFHYCKMKLNLKKSLIYLHKYSLSIQLSPFSACYRVHKLLLNSLIQIGIDKRDWNRLKYTHAPHVLSEFYTFSYVGNCFSNGPFLKNDEKRATKCTLILLCTFSTYFVFFSHNTNNTYFAEKMTKNNWTKPSIAWAQQKYLLKLIKRTKL